jgi:cysteine desulfurase
MASVQSKHFGNASSIHSFGSNARAILEKARRGIAKLIGCKPVELYFTSGGTEANNWVFRGVLEARPHAGIITSAIEHKSVLKAAEAAWWDRPVHKSIVDKDGVVDIDNLEWGIKGIIRGCPWDRKPSCLVSVMLANNETGVIQPVREVVDVVNRLLPDSLVHTDAVQMFGKHSVDVKELGVDLMTISAHKVGGPKGIGALYVREGVDIDPLIRGGHQERDRRAGTENVAAAEGFHVAAAARQENLAQYAAKVYDHTAHLYARLCALDEIWVNGGERKRLCNTLNVGFRGVDSEALVLVLSGLGVLVSNGSACESGSLEGSHVLQAMGQSEEDSRSAIRFSLSDDLPGGSIPVIADRVIESVNALRDMPNVTL